MNDQQKSKEKKPRQNGRPKGHKKSPEHAIKLKEAGKLGGRPRRRVIYEKRILEPGEKVKLPEPDIVLEEILFYIRIRGTEEEIAAQYLISVETLNKKLKEHFGLGFLELKKQVAAAGDLAMRVTQFNHAKKNFNAAKHLGEIWLNQRTTSTVEVRNLGVPVYLPEKKTLND